MTSRILPPEEWGRLAGTEAESFISRLNAASRVIVVEADGAIVGCHILQPVLHAEGLWIHPDFRKRASVGRHLWRRVQDTARDWFGVQWFVTGCGSDEVRALLEHVAAVKLPDHYVVPIGGSRCLP